MPYENLGFNDMEPNLMRLKMIFSMIFKCKTAYRFV